MDYILIKMIEITVILHDYPQHLLDFCTVELSLKIHQSIHFHPLYPLLGRGGSIHHQISMHCTNPPP